MKPTILIPMAGNGTRFSQAGYKNIKPLISVHGKPMIERVIECVGVDGNWIFVVQKHHRDKYNLDEILQTLRPGCKVVDTGGGVTEGAVCSILLAEKYIDLDMPLIIINSDNIIHWDVNQLNRLWEEDLDGIILCFRDTQSKWSFVKIDENEHVVEVAEKNPISDIATAGMYIWKTGHSFITAAKQMIKANIRVNNEFYLCPVYNQNISNGEKIGIVWADEMYGIGTPEDLNHYLSIVK